jgi:hypothetical protein
MSTRRQRKRKMLQNLEMFKACEAIFAKEIRDQENENLRARNSGSAINYSLTSCHSPSGKGVIPPNQLKKLRRIAMREAKDKKRFPEKYVGTFQDVEKLTPEQVLRWKSWGTDGPAYGLVK